MYLKIFTLSPDCKKIAKATVFLTNCLNFLCHQEFPELQRNFLGSSVFLRGQDRETFYQSYACGIVCMQLVAFLIPS